MSGAKEAAVRLATSWCHYGILVIDGAASPSFRCDAAFVAGLADDLRDIFQAINLWSRLYKITNAVTGATAAYNGSYSGSLGTPTWPAGGGTALASNTALVT